ncbi:hypothetical protein [Comamonas kerstersii]|uniref:hypothetical protein n=1 Tax=Comamonas kerstersii TaxID=225992 RepID=UPI002595EF76|nr:hypothetical protein [Comamonas kerstersii]
MTTRIYRDRDGWNAVSQFELSARRVLKIRTCKRSIGAGLQTTASVWHDTGDGSMRHAMGLGTGCGDFSQTLMLTQPKRITEKAVTEQHESILRELASIRVKVEQFYALQREENEATTAA